MKRILLLGLLLLLFAFRLQGEAEPNDNAKQANLLQYNGIQTGTLDGTDGYDWFYFDLPQAGIWQLNIIKTGGGNCWFNLRAGESDSNSIISTYYQSYWDFPAPGDTWKVPLLAGHYFLELKKGDYTVNYTIASQLLPPEWTSDVEPNNSAATAIPVPVNSAVSGTIHYNEANGAVDQDDWYVVDIPQGGFLRIIADKRGTGNGWLYILDGENAALPELSNMYFQYFESPPEGWQIYYPALKGRYYLRIGNGDGIVNYRLQVDLIPPAYPEDPEPNDNRLTALPMTLNDTVSGLIGYYRPNYGVDKTDWYVWKAPENGLLKFVFSKKGFSNGNLRLLDTNGEIASYYFGYGDWGFSADKLVPGGTYYLVIETLDLYFDYRLALQFIPAPLAGFTYRRAGGSVAFDNTSLRGDTYKWTFDDGTTGSTVNAYHEYAQPANYNVCLAVANAGGEDSVCQTVVVPGLARAYPDKAGNTGDATLRIFGGGLDTAYRARLFRNGALLAQSSYTGFGGKSAILCSFDLRGLAPGVCDLVVEKPGAPSYKIPGGFTILTGNAPDPWVRITGRDRILYNTWTTFTVNYGNNGNVDARLVPVWFVFSRDTGLQVEFPNAFFFDPDTASGEPSEAGLSVDLDSLFGQAFRARAYPLLLPLIPAGSVQSFQIRIKTGGNLKIQAWCEKPWYQSPINQNKLECISDALSEAPPDLNLNQDRVLCAQYFTAIFYDRIMDDYFREARTNFLLQAPDFFSSVLKGLRAAVKICGVNSADDRQKIAAWVTNWIVNRQLIDRNPAAKGASCPVEFAPENLQSKPMTAVSSLDPNEKTGLNGYGAAHYQVAFDVMPYTIHFENMASASAPAHQVVVTDWLDTAQFDLSSFAFDEVRIGAQRIRPVAGAGELVQDIYLPDRGVVLRLLAALDPLTGKLEWVFRSLDSLTLRDVEDPDLGFLPPNALPPEGEASVSFSVRVKSPLPHGAQLRNDALITFDANPPIPTNEHFLTIDRLAPESAVAPLPPTIADQPFEVQWIGTDKGSGIAYYNVYVSVNDGPDSLWMPAATAISAIFSGEVGNVYRFYSLATDHVGNVEETPSVPDATTTILVGAGEAAAVAAGIRVYPNPARDYLRVSYTGKDAGCLTLSSPDGRVYRCLYLDSPQVLEIPLGGLPKGLYLWSWVSERQGKAGGRLVVME